ncbi:hypothetical protein HPULCUR_006803 [Helicostylum pulchrum]|uniref:Uncharacterized protein n=1 Tax=Helicostylum pulchrum TaxID=562976 RepID=A0ABP9Y2Y7_9FUNG
MELVKPHLGDYDYDQYFKYGHLIKKLTIKIGSYYKLKTRTFENQRTFSKLELLALLSQLPKLSEIYMDDLEYAEEYLRILLDTDMKHINKIDIENFRDTL